MCAAHLSGRHPSAEEGAGSGRHLGAIPIVGKAGTCAVYDGRLWHQVGTNSGEDIDPRTGKAWRLAVFMHFCAPFIRMQENLTLTTDREEVIASASPALLERLGLQTWNGFGRVGQQAPLTGTELGLPRMPAAGDSAQVGVARGAPQLTREEMAADCAALDEAGFCVIDGSLQEEEVRRLAARVAEQARAEASAGVASIDEQGVQRVLTCINKGDEFVQLLLEPDHRELVGHILGEEYQVSPSLQSARKDFDAELTCRPSQLSHATATIRGPGSAEPPLWSAQWWFPQPMRVSRGGPAIRPGSVGPELARSEAWATPSDEFIAPPVTAIVSWALSDVNMRLVEKSHLSGREPTEADEEAAATSGAIKLKEGSCLVSDGRLWRADGEGTVLEFAFIGPQMRMEENNVLATTSEVLEAMPPEAKAQLGFNVWYSYGNAGMATRAMVTSGDPRTPMDGPSQSVTGGTARR